MTYDNVSVSIVTPLL